MISWEIVAGIVAIGLAFLAAVALAYDEGYTKGYVAGCKEMRKYIFWRD
jgi:hypothetical protein